MKRRCVKCGTEWEIKGPVAFREECPECAAFVHTCANCLNYDARNRICRLPTTDPISDAHEMNFCEEYEYGPGGGEMPGKGAAPARAAAGPASKPSEKPLTPDEARRRFEALFRDTKK